jgi:hypothetical protein
MAGTKPELTYLFEADFSDGTTYHQGLEDTPINHDAGSAFTDVMARIDDVLRFHVVSLDGAKRATVDLVDGHFEVNGVAFTLHPATVLPKNLRLIYFRETRVESTVNAKHEELSRRHYVARNCIGWQMTDAKGKNHQFMIGID